jgi:hypothetical protein
MNRLLPWRVKTLLVAVIAYASLSGCSQVAPDRDVRMARGYVYYLDGAGGGGLMNWSGGVREGLVAAGYDGAGEMFSWETGMGVVADQTSSESYKRGKAAALAEKIRAYTHSHRGAPVTLMGLSAGTAVAVFTLEALPLGHDVDNVVLLSGSLSAGYDLTKALHHVRGRLYVFTSPKDAVLGFLLPFAGTADRAVGTTDTIGKQGARMPANPSFETRREYGKVVEVPWNEKFSRYGHQGGHTDSVKARFIEAVVAPIILTRTAPFTATSAETAGEVPNPDFTRWAAFAPGSYVVFDGYQESDGVREPMRLKATLVAKDADRLVIERTFEPLSATMNQLLLSRRFFVAATTKPEDNPFTHPQAKIRDLAPEEIDVAGRRLACQGREVQAAAAFAEWGSDVRATVYSNPEVPSGSVKIDLRTHMEGRPVAFAGRVVEMSVAGK